MIQGMATRSGASRPDLDTSRWQTVRAQVRRRDGNRCVICGTTERLSVHHVVKARDGGLDTPDNLVTLCVTHHRQADAARRPRPTPADDPERGIFYGPPDDWTGEPTRWSRAWYDWRNASD